MTEIKNIRDFREAVKNVLAAALPDCRVEAAAGNKNNSIHLYGLYIRAEGMELSPIIYMEPYFSDFQKGKPFRDIIKDIAGTYIKCLEEMDRSHEIKPDIVRDFALARERICYKLVNRELNSNLLAESPHRDFYGLAIVYYILVASEGEKKITADVTYDLMHLWGISDEQLLYDLACENTPRMHRGRVEPMYDTVGRCLGYPEADNEERTRFSYRCFDIALAEEEPVISFYIASTVNQINGASVILYPGLLEALAEKIGNFLAIPSSIEEFLIRACDIEEAEKWPEQIEDISLSQVSPEKVLSQGGCFYYHADSHKLEVIGKK